MKNRETKKQDFEALRKELEQSHAIFVTGFEKMTVQQDFELRKTVRMARRPRGDCGGFRKRRRQIPIDNPGLGEWTIQFDQSRRLKDPAVEPIVFVRLGILIRLVRD